MIEDEEFEEETAEEEEEILLEPKEQKNLTNPELSLHAMEGEPTPRTIRLLGHVNKKSVSVLIDTGSTHNFMDPRVV